MSRLTRGKRNVACRRVAEWLTSFMAISMDSLGELCGLKYVKATTTQLSQQVFFAHTVEKNRVRRILVQTDYGTKNGILASSQCLLAGILGHLGADSGGEGKCNGTGKNGAKKSTSLLFFYFFRTCRLSLAPTICPGSPRIISG